MTNNNQNGQRAGIAGEELIRQFIDNKLTRIISFASPTTSEGAQVADILIWRNKLVILVEVKTRFEGTASIENWARNRVQEAVVQITGNYERIRNNEEINLHNDYYHLRLDCPSIIGVVGIVVLVHEGEISVVPSQVEPEIYSKSLPIHVFSWMDLEEMAVEIDTISDLHYYLHDRYEFVKHHDIPIGFELEALGYYKAHDYHFPNVEVDFRSTSFWDDYQTEFAQQINNRDLENQASGWIDQLENVFTEPRRLHDRHPLGLYFAWEVGSLPRRFRAVIGQRMDQAQNWFLEGHRSRRFAFRNEGTGNWLVFYYARGSVEQVQRELKRLVRLQLVYRVHHDQFQHAVYGFGFQVSIIDPPQLMGLAGAIVNADSEILQGNFSQEEIDEASRYWGGDRGMVLREFPNN
jgi:hypothetical protein